MDSSPFNLVPVFVLTFFRIAGMMIYAPLFGSAKVPQRMKVLLALVLAVGMTAAVRPPAQLPDTTWELALGIGGEMMFGVATGLILSFVFIAAQWAGEMIGQQMGLNMSEVFDPAFGGGGSIVGELYFMLTLVIFLAIGGHRAMLAGVHESFAALPLLSLRVDADLVDLVVGMFAGATKLAIRLASPMLLTMLVVDLALGCIGKTMPQMNVMTMGVSLRSVIGLAVLIVSVGLTAGVLEGELQAAVDVFRLEWAGGGVRAN